jgi:hypothetical protein
VDDDLPVVAHFGDAGLTPVEKVDGLLDALARLGVGRGELPRPVPQLFDLRLQRLGDGPTLLGAHGADGCC